MVAAVMLQWCALQMLAEHYECEFQMWILWELSIAKMKFMKTEQSNAFVNVNLWEMSIMNVNFLRAEHCECEFFKSWALQVLIYENWALQIWSFLRAELCVCEFSYSWALWTELSFATVNFLIAEHCEHMSIYESWALWMWISW